MKPMGIAYALLQSISFVKPYSENDYAAHAYMVKPTMIESMVNMYKVNMPVDVYIDKTFKNDIFATFYSMVF